METTPLTKVDLYFATQSYSNLSCWSALMKSRTREKSLARISKLPPEEMAAEGIKEVIGFLETSCLVGLYTNSIIPAGSSFEPYKVEWHEERNDNQKVHFDRVSIVAKFLLTLAGLSPEITYLIPVVVRNCWTAFVVTGNEYVEVVSGINNSTDKERRLHLLAVTKGLLVAPKPPRPICIYTDSEYVLTGQHGLPGWSRTWRTKQGQPLQNFTLLNQSLSHAPRGGAEIEM